MEETLNPTGIEKRLKDEARAQVIKLLEVLDSKKAVDAVAIDVAEKTIVTEWFIVCSGTSTIQVKAICDEVEDKYAEIGLTLRRREGYNEGRWIVLDFGYILLHIFHPDEREYYNIERLWIDGTGNIIKYPETAE